VRRSIRRERGQLTRHEWERITSPRPVVCRVLERCDFARPEDFGSKPTNDDNTHDMTTSEGENESGEGLRPGNLRPQSPGGLVVRVV
jgi:hypothetical protein